MAVSAPANWQYLSGWPTVDGRAMGKPAGSHTSDCVVARAGVRKAGADPVIIDSTCLPVRMREFAPGGGREFCRSALARMKVLIESLERVLSEKRSVKLTEPVQSNTSAAVTHRVQRDDDKTQQHCDHRWWFCSDQVRQNLEKETVAGRLPHYPL